MFEDVTAQRVEMPQLISVIEFTDVRLDMKMRANVYNGFVDKGRAYLVIQPVAQFLGAQWGAIDLDDTAFPVNVEEMLDIVEVAREA